VISVVKIQQAFESLVGRKVAKTTIYRMLDRHGRRGVLPRPRLQRATNKPRRAANEGAVSLFFEEVGRRHPDEFVLMVLDGAGWHRARELKVPGNMHLVFLPSYSPEVNPVEHFRRSIRENWFRNKVFQSMGGCC